MSQRNKDLYRWERVSKPRVYSRSQRVTSENDIQDWIQKVEDASGRAAAVTFGTKYTRPATSVGSRPQLNTVEDVHLHDAAFSEAQDLLQEWVRDKLDINGEMETPEDAWTRKTESEIKREWDHLLPNDLEPETTPRSKTKTSARDPYNILNEDQDHLVDEVLQKLMNKEVVEEDFVLDLGLEDRSSRCPDPRTKMTLRHQQVKENREKREREKERKLREQRSVKEAQFRARQIVQQEEKAKAMKQKSEEEAIQREMAKIKKTMQIEKQLRQEQILREQREKEVFERKVREEMALQREEERKIEGATKQLASQREKDVTSRLTELQTYETKQNFKLMQRCFSGWYNIIVQRHLLDGKLKATADWKLLLRTFKAWKSYTISCQIERETKLYQEQAKNLQRKAVVAEKHCQQSLLRKCFLAWQLFLVQKQNAQIMNDVHDQTKSKMAAFLDAAATGKLWSARSDNGQNVHEDGLTSRGSTARQLDEMFCGPGRPKPGPGSAWSETSSVIDVTTNGPSSGKHNRPKQSWQLSRKDVKVTKADLDRVAKAHSESAHSTQDSLTDRSDASKTSKAPFVPNKFEHRHAAQQKMLDNQQKQIKEQQRLIEEMQFLQKQQLMQQSLTQQQLLQQQKLSDVNRMERPPLHTEGSRLGATDDEHDCVSEVTCTDFSSEQAVTELETGSLVTMVTARTDMTSASDAKSSTSDTKSAASVAKSAVSSNVSLRSETSKHSKFVKSMESRAEERTRLKREREEKRKKAEQEKLMKLQAEEEERKQQEELEKRQKIEQFREKKRLEKQREQEKQEEVERLKRLSAIAGEHHRLAIMKYRGWSPWRHLVTMARDKMATAEKHFSKSLLRRVLQSWHAVVNDDVQHKRTLADDMHQYILVKRCFRNWKRLGQHMLIQEQKAQRHHAVTLKVKVIHAWSNHATEEKVASWRKERMAREHDKKRMVLTALRAWRRFPQVIKSDNERKKRLADMRKKVSSFLPDFDSKSHDDTAASEDLFLDV